MIACDRATYLSSKKLETRLTPGERISLGLHHMSCRICKIYEKDIIALNHYLKDQSVSHHYLEPEQKSRISNKVLSELEK